MLITWVSSKELGTNCWLPKRFLKGSCCDRVWTCSYPEKKHCMAVQAEIDALWDKSERISILMFNILKAIGDLENMQK